MNATFKRITSSLLLFGFVALPCGLTFQDEACASSTVPVAETQTPALTTAHISYIAGYPDGTMLPNNAVTRAEAVTFIYRLLTDPASGTGTCSYTDVSDSDWFADPVRALCRLGLTAGSTSFRPNEPITRAEFVSILVKLAGTVTGSASFSDVPADHWAADAISKAAALGWIGGYDDGTFRPEGTLTRAEACSIINRMTNRSGDSMQAEVLLSLGLYKDVSASHWAGTDLVEATIAHSPGGTLLNEVWSSFDTSGHTLEAGIHEVGGTLYAVDRNGSLIQNQTIGAYQASATGALTQISSGYQVTVPYISMLDGLEAVVGCEPISALMGLQGKGYATDVSAASFLDNLPYSESDPAEGFVGSPYVSDGRYTSIDPQPLANYCNTYCGGVQACEDFSGASISDVQHELLTGNFIVAYQTYWWEPIRYANFLINGQWRGMVANNHVRLISGYDPDRGYFVSDPYNNFNRWETYQFWIDANTFESLWSQRQMGMVIR